MAIDADLNGKQIPQRPGSRSAKLRNDGDCTASTQQLSN
jgi:hypothetical protein